MNSKTLFRTILVASIVFGILSAVAGITLQTTLPYELQSYLAKKEASTSNAGIIAVIVALVIVLPACIIITIGVWRFRRWARTAWVILTVAGVVITPFLGEFIMNSWEIMFFDISSSLAGVLIAMMFLEPIKSAFGIATNKEAKPDL